MIKIKTIKVEKEEQVIEKASCSFCDVEFNETATSCNGFGQINISFGYGSKFDDDCFNLEICDYCFLKRYGKLLERQFKEKGYDLKKIKAEITAKTGSEVKHGN